MEIRTAPETQRVIAPCSRNDETSASLPDAGVVQNIVNHRGFLSVAVVTHQVLIQLFCRETWELERRSDYDSRRVVATSGIQIEFL